MVVDLDRKDIINLLRGISPSYEVWNSIPQELGSFHGGMDDGWDWNYISLDVPYSDEYLYDLYLKRKGLIMSYTPELNKPCKGFCSECTLFNACSQLRRSKPPKEYYKYKVNYNNLFE